MRRVKFSSEPAVACSWLPHDPEPPLPPTPDELLRAERAFESSRNPPAVAATSPPTTPTWLSKLQGVLKRLDISVVDANDLRPLRDFRVVVIADDSGSMAFSAKPSHSRMQRKSPTTRWEELKETLRSIVEVADCLGDAGVDVHFLNRGSVWAVRDSSDQRLLKALSQPPDGNTPLTQTLQRAAETSCQGSEKKVLMLILTDGEPSGGPDLFKVALGGLLSRQVKVQIMACSGEDDEIAWLDKLDRVRRVLHVTDDYFTELEQVLRRGLAKKFTRADWCLRAMLGPVSEKFDSWDEKLKRSKKFCQDCSEAVCAVQ